MSRLHNYLNEEKKKDIVRYEEGKKLNRGEKEKLLQNIHDVYKESDTPTEEKGIDRKGDVIVGYAYSPEYFIRSDITGKMLRYYIKLPDDKVAHPSELYSNITKAQIETEMEKRNQEKLKQKHFKEQRLKRIADNKSEANNIYKMRNRHMVGSYLAKNNRGQIVRVDGTDKEDVQFFKKMKFKAITDPVKEV